MAGRQEKPEEIVSKLRQTDVLQVQGTTVAEALRQIGVAPVASFPEPGAHSLTF
jgi:cobalamin biosynthesis Mg chelatase CobN